MIKYMEEIILIDSPEALEKSLRNIEKIVRSSKEYRTYLAYTKEYLEHRNCSYFKNVDFIDNKLSLEVHHIISLYELCTIVGLKMLEDDKKYLPIDVAKKVLKLHLNDLVPTITLSKTIHEMVHQGLYQIPKDSETLNLGNWREFIKTYKNYLSTDNFLTYKYFLDEEFTEYMEKLDEKSS